MPASSLKADAAIALSLCACLADVTQRPRAWLTSRRSCRETGAEEDDDPPPIILPMFKMPWPISLWIDKALGRATIGGPAFGYASSSTWRYLHFDDGGGGS